MDKWCEQSQHEDVCEANATAIETHRTLRQDMLGLINDTVALTWDIVGFPNNELAIDTHATFKNDTLKPALEGIKALGED